MFEILERKELAPTIWFMKVSAPRVARSAKPGQFVIVRADQRSERIPLTISDYDPERGTVSMVIQAIGVSTRKLVDMEQGMALADFAGPLGQPAEFVHEDIAALRHKRILLIGGGLGTAPVYPQAKWLHANGVPVDVMIGAKTGSMLIMADEMGAVADNLYIATDDGSQGYRGMVTGLLRELLDERGKKYDLVIAIGPMVMMKFVAQTTLEYGISTIVSLNTLMVDGTGMCGACRVTVGGKTRFACIDGPEFDAHQVDFDEAMRRQGMYKTIEERLNMIDGQRRAGHECKIGLDKK